MEPFIRECFKGKTSKKSVKKLGSRGHTDSPRMTKDVIFTNDTGNSYVRKVPVSLYTEHTYTVKGKQYSAPNRKDAIKQEQDSRKPIGQRALQQDIDRSWNEEQSRYITLAEYVAEYKQSCRDAQERRRLANIEKRERWNRQQELKKELGGE